MGSATGMLRLVGVAVCLVALRVAAPAPAQDASRCNEVQESYASDGRTEDRFGRDVGVSGNWAVVGAPQHDGPVTQPKLEAGAAYIFEKTPTGWVERQMLQPAGLITNDRFGSSVAIAGSLLIVGSPGDGNGGGAAYIYRRSGSTWAFEAKIQPSFRLDGDRFGEAVALDGSTALIGAPQDDSTFVDSGAAYVFQPVLGVWTQIVKLLPGDPDPNKRFGVSVDVDSGASVAAIGAHFDDENGDNAGAVYVFRRGLTWGPEAKILATTGADGDLLGWSVAVEGDRIVAGAYLNDDSGLADIGAACVFERSGSSWSQTAELLPPNPFREDHYGWDVDLNEERILVGALHKTIGGVVSGAAYLYDTNGSGWPLSQEIAPGDPSDSQNFAHAVALDCENALIGARLDDDLANNAGSVYFYDCTGCVTEPGNNDPECNAGADIQAGCDGVFKEDATASDPDGDPIEISWSSNCGASFRPPDELATFVTTGGSCDVTCTLTLTVTDDQGGVCTDSALLIVDDRTPPDIDQCPEETTVECDGQGNGPNRQSWFSTFTASDTCTDTTRDRQPGPSVPGCAGTLEEDWTFVATDECGNWSDCVSTFATEDTTPPDVTKGSIGTCYQDPRDAEQDALSATSSSDVCSEPLVSRAGSAGTCNAIVTVTVTDECNNSATVEYETVIDTEPPVLTCPTPLRKECNGPGGVARDDSEIQDWLAEATASDNCGPVQPENDAPSVFPSGCEPGRATTVTFTGRDECGLVATCASTVTVVDTTAPELTPGSIGECYPDEQSAESAAEAATVATDSCTDPVQLSSSTSGACDALVTVTGSDACDNSDSVDYPTRIDGEPPEARCPPPTTVECDGAGNTGERQAWLNSFMATDNCDDVQEDPGTPVITTGCGGTSTEERTFAASDLCGLQDSCSSSFEIEDTTAPSVTAGTIGECYTSVRDAEDDAVAATTAADVCSEPLDFEPATAGTCQATVTVTVTDECGNDAAATYATSVDDEDPAISCPAPITVECSEPGGTPRSNPQIQAWLSSVSATDNCGIEEITNDAPAFFASACLPGERTVVIFTATDTCGRQAACRSTVTVVDTTGPALTPPAPITLECNTTGGVAGDDPQILAWLDEATAEDACGGIVALTNDAPAFFESGCPPGNATLVTFEAEDECGNRSSASSSVTVQDSLPPEVAVIIEETCLWPPNHRMIEVGTYDVQDVCDPEPVTSGVAVTSDEHAALMLGSGGRLHCPDASVDGLARQGRISLRAERSGVPGKDNGRAYGNILLEASDSCGNTGASGLSSPPAPVNGCPGVVCVPHDQQPRSPGQSRGNDPGGSCPAVDDGQIFDAGDCGAGGPGPLQP